MLSLYSSPPLSVAILLLPALLRMKHFLQTWRQTEGGDEGNSAVISFIRYDYLEYKFIVIQVINVSTFLGDVIKFPSDRLCTALV